MKFLPKGKGHVNMLRQPASLPDAVGDAAGAAVLAGHGIGR